MFQMYFSMQGNAFVVTPVALRNWIPRDVMPGAAVIAGNSAGELGR